MVRRTARALSALLRRPLPAPPDSVRLGPLRDGAFTSRLHDERNAALLGIALGVSFTVCFVTGVLSHAIQHPPSWFAWPTRPVSLYRVTQGLHVATGLASIPLLFAKLWTVFPKLWSWPPVANISHALERLSLLALVGGATFMLFTGLANIALWYPFAFFFPSAHYMGAFITIGALLIHIGTKATVTRRALSRQLEAGQPYLGAPGALTRRGFLWSVVAASGAVTLTTVGQTVGPLRRLALLAPRLPDRGVQGFPVNRSAAAAGVIDRAHDPGYTITVAGGVPRPFVVGIDELRAMPMYEAQLPIACVEGWSASPRWTGVRLRDLLDRAGAQATAAVRIESLQQTGRYRSSVLTSDQARDHLTLLAVAVDGEPLHLDHGFPCRLIAANRPGVMQTKWVTKVVVL